MSEHKTDTDEQNSDLMKKDIIEENTTASSMISAGKILLLTWW